ncbi:MAG TPA: tRNA lysidine(34) synthetase TilS [Chloroflexota bacterium]|nr:tRNA lysidine(34) synthetase TilS [Chloroflexota bacterium]
MSDLNLQSVLRRTAEGTKVLPPEGPLVVAVSGGADSLCLLHLLKFQTPGMDGRLMVATVDHGLMPTSREAAERVMSLADEWGMPCMVRRVDVRAQMRNEGQSMESTARRLRYEALGELAVEVGAVAILLGHSADDQAETILMHLFRGSGLKGLTGMRAVEPVPVGAFSMPICRPLLKLWREETRLYCRDAGVEFVDDPSNEDRVHLRNRIRLDLLPMIEAMFAGAKESLLRMGEIAGRDDEYLSALTAGAEKVVRAEDGLEPRLWAALPGSLRYRTARNLLLEQENDVTEARVEQMVATLVRDLELRREKSLPSVEAWTSPDGVILDVPGRAYLGQYDLGAVLVSGPDLLQRATVANSWEAYLDANVVRAPLQVRGWRSGDRMQPLGAPGSRKLQDIFVDRKVGPELKARLIVVECNGLILWVPGITLAEQARVTLETMRAIHLKITPGLHNLIE